MLARRCWGKRRLGCGGIGREMVGSLNQGDGMGRAPAFDPKRAVVESPWAVALPLHPSFGQLRQVEESSYVTVEGDSLNSAVSRARFS